ncbi:MAG: ABC transporter permease [Candidatus Dactylopiibacterium carminicum]|uniref:ABC transporter permease n=1 Tax=Candidatus Dactylopiibacterium carminicum TaxID=857335 RepID=A0A272EWV8_9RHOO|nr:ABC transporter permease [Candidatus Dactylopiibacterium carminicum]KAF7600029.1 ABC transporter permease [Candidatus Dactylopiibacterium carminicum]PAS94581.1 MAG: ABC transporter permease [Candidatus Dactylopiibacterium carminicum]PAT00033.1 MAG: ABC transporter permease [Candidatus Dactylopiibacterium carminicum]
MILRMLRQSWRRNPRRKLLAVATVFLAASLLSALMLVSIDIGDQMAKEMKSYGANILLEPAGQAVLPSLLGEGEDNPLTEQSTLPEAELPNLMEIFWRNDLVGFAPLLGGEIAVEGANVRVIGTFFDQPLAVPDDPGYHTGQKIISPYWQIDGRWPDDARAEALAGAELAARHGWTPGTQLNVGGEPLLITGILHSGGDEEAALVAPLARVQTWLGQPGRIGSIRVSALTVPENELSRRALRNPDALDAETYDQWYCTAYVSSIAHQLEEVVSGSIARPIWQVAASEGVIIDKIQWLLIMATGAALIAAAMGIASLMTSTLIERAKEIGLMKAMGAHDWRIALLFYAEAAMSSLAGGVLGCLAGWGLARAIGWQLFGEALAFSWIVVPAVLLVSLLIALAGTWFPARRIVRLYPAEVLYGRQ